jgi:hypothetical protein
MRSPVTAGRGEIFRSNAQFVFIHITKGTGR